MVNQEHEYEFLVSHRGHYIFHCECGATTRGKLADIPITRPFIACGANGISDCERVLNLRNFAERKDYFGARVKQLLKIEGD